MRCEANLLGAAVRSLLEPYGGRATPAGMASPRTLVSGRSMDRQESRREEERQREMVEEDGGTTVVLDRERWADGGLYGVYPGGCTERRAGVRDGQGA
jgi:hypothetical protein